MTVKFNNDGLAELVETVKKQGMRVWAFQHNEAITQVYIEHENRICTVSIDLGTLRYSTVHRPSKGCGTGYGINETPAGVDMALLHEALNIHVPNWANRDRVTKYTSMEDYLTTSTSAQILKFYEI